MRPVALALRFAFVALAAGLLTAASTKRRRGPSKDDEDDDKVADPGPPLFLTPMLEQGKVEEAQAAARTEPPLVADVESYSGFLTVDKARDANLFFWFFPAEQGMADAPVMLWLQGGPGSSSMLGVFLEHGPARLKKGRKLKRRKHAWTRAASMLYVDSPVGAGFSFVESPSGLVASSEQAAADLLQALRQFYTLFPALRANELFLAGESYAGKYVPALALAVHAANAEPGAAALNLRGLVVGNPLADPESMMDYGDYLHQLGLVDEAGRQRFREREDAVRELVRQQRWDDAQRARDALIGRGEAGNATLFRELTGFRCRFNYLHDSCAGRGSYLSHGYRQFVQRAAVRHQLHVGNLTFHDRGAVAESLRLDVMRSARPWYEQLLQHYDVLLYNGQLDVADPYPLMVNFIRRLQWPGAEAYATAERHLWIVDGEVAGYAKTAGRLTEVLVRAAGHMVPADQPKWALDLITKFVSHRPIAS